MIPSWPFATFARAAAISIVAALLLASPAVRVDLGGDERNLINFLEATRPCEGSGGLWNFYGKNAEERSCLVEQGLASWWVKPHLKMTFFRPLSSALFKTEHALWGRWGAGYQLNTLLWFVGFLLVAGLMFRKLLLVPAAGVALFVLAIEGSHWEAIGVPSAIHHWVACVLSLLGVLFHVRWREDQRPAFAVASVAFCAVALLGSETALQAFAYIVAYELFGATDHAGKRARALVPIAVLVVGYLVFYKAMGFGTFGVRYYADPIAEPLAYLKHVAAGVPAMLLALLGEVHGIHAAVGRDSFLYNLQLGTSLPLLGLAITVHGALWFGVRRKIDPRTRRVVRWLLVGTLGALLPVLGGDFGPRLLLMPSVGIAAWVGVMLVHGWRTIRSSDPSGRIGIGIAWTVVFIVHALIAPAVLVTNLVNLREVFLAEAEGEEPDLRGHIEIPAEYTGDVIVLVAPGVLETPFLRRLEPNVRGWFSVLQSDSTIELRRVGDRRVELVDMDAPDSPPPKDYLPVGTPISLPLGLTATIQDVRTKGPRPWIHRMTIDTDRPLDDPSLLFLAWKRQGLAHITLPPVGGTIMLGDGQPAP